MEKYMLLKKYWKSNLFFILIIFGFTFLDVYGDNHWLSVVSILTRDVFWSHFFVYVLIYIILTLFIDFIVLLFKKIIRNFK